MHNPDFALLLAFLYKRTKALRENRMSSENVSLKEVLLCFKWLASLFEFAKILVTSDIDECGTVPDPF